MLPLLLLACSSPSSPTSGPAGLPDATGHTGQPSPLPSPELECAAEATLQHGRLCAIAPSSLDPSARDRHGTDTAPDRLLGFGYHVVALPSSPASTTPWLHFGGSFGRPYDPDQQTFPSAVWLDELMAAGHTVVQPAYANRYSVNDSCMQPAGLSEDDCAGRVREEVLTGADVSPQRQVPPADSVDRRLADLLRHLMETGVLPSASGLPDWSASRISGHSQGGGLAYYIARFRGVRFACMLASPYDAADDVDPSRPPIADWFDRGLPLTTPPALGQLVVLQDESAGAFRATGRRLGLDPGTEQIEVDRPDLTADEAHAAPLSDPDLAAARASACLR